MSEKVRRSEWGIKDWFLFMPESVHCFMYDCNTHLYEAKIVKNNCSFSSGTDKLEEEAIRKCVEEFCNDKDIPLPWLPDAPDFSTWSREQCEEYIWSQKCQFSVRIDFSEAGIKSDYAAVAVYINGFGGYFGSPSLGPTLKDYQNAAAWLWEQVNK